jgi:ATP-dependent exoDNAse (exonuclease V) beta subunit
MALVGDDADLQEVYDTERNLLYVACTRARDHLLVTGVEPVSEWTISQEAVKVFPSMDKADLTVNKQDTLQRLQHINGIRNKVMHPVKGKAEYEDDYRFARRFLAELGSDAGS